MDFWVLTILLFFGILLILLEVVVPHGLSILAGFLFIAFACFYCFKTEGPRIGTIYLFFAGTLSGGAAWVSFRWGLRSMTLRPPPDPMASKAPADPNPTPHPPPTGARGHVIQPLHPTGTIEIEGRRWAARSVRTEVEIGVDEEVEVRGRDSIYILVDRADRNPR